MRRPPDLGVCQFELVSFLKGKRWEIMEAKGYHYGCIDGRLVCGAPSAMRCMERIVRCMASQGTKKGQRHKA